MADPDPGIMSRIGELVDREHREFGMDPEQAKVRDEETVERYQQ